MSYEEAFLDISKSELWEVKYAVLNCLCLILTGSTFPRSVYTYVKKFPRSLSRALKISRYYRVNNKHGGFMEGTKVGYLTILYLHKVQDEKNYLYL